MKKTCIVTNCCNFVYSDSFCLPHFYRNKRHGHPLGGGTSKGAARDFAQRMIDGIEISEDCIIWPFYRNNKGYPYLRLNNKNVVVGRFICSVINGDPKEKQECLHSCGNGHLGCVNPRHLRWGTQEENKIDKLAHGRHVFGEKSYLSKLKNEEVVEIKKRLSEGETAKSISEDFNITKWAVYNIKQGKNWKRIS